VKNTVTMIAILIAILSLDEAGAAENKSFAFVNSQYVVTAESAGEHSFVLNFINLSEFVIVVQPNEFIYKGASGRFYIGQVYQKETKDMRGESHRYSASSLLKGKSFAGLTVVGAFQELDAIEEISMRIGAKRLFLQPMEKNSFDQLAKKITALDLTAEDLSEALTAVDIPEMGNVRSTDGTSEWDHDWQGLISSDGSNPPKIIERPEILPTVEARKSNTYGRVKLSAIINKSGGIQDLKVIKGLGKGLDQRAIEGVQNSWVFLPATKNGEVYDSSFVFEVEFLPEKKQ